MKIYLMSAALCVSLAACGDGNPFSGTTTGTITDGDIDVNQAGIPAILANDLESFTYNPNTQTLTIRGLNSDDSPFEESYTRAPALDRVGYEAYTQQDGSLDRHSTAFVKDINGTRAGVTATGGQFGYFFVGGAYGNTIYSPPIQPGTNAQGGLVSYAGNYVGFLNRAGSGEDLLPVAPGTSPSFLPNQVAEVTGRILMTASFSDTSVSGIVTERVVFDTAQQLEDIELSPAAIAADGTFTSEVTQNLLTKGTYGGIFGGTDATEIVGVVQAEDHIQVDDGEIEYGVFVLGACGTPAQDAVCNQPNP